MADLQRPIDTEVSDSISLMISILLCYPELGTIKLNPEKKLFKFTFILSEIITEEERKKFQNDFMDSEETFFWLNKVKFDHIGLDFKTFDNFTIIEINRDVDSLSQDEISLMVALILKHFEEYVVIEANDSLMDEDLRMQEELIGHMLESLKAHSEEKPLIAYREEGRVLVFNK